MSDYLVYDILDERFIQSIDLWKGLTYFRKGVLYTEQLIIIDIDYDMMISDIDYNVFLSVIPNPYQCIFVPMCSGSVDFTKAFPVDETLSLKENLGCNYKRCIYSTDILSRDNSRVILNVNLADGYGNLKGFTFTVGIVSGSCYLQSIAYWDKKGMSSFTIFCGMHPTIDNKNMLSVLTIFPREDVVISNWDVRVEYE